MPMLPPDVLVTVLSFLDGDVFPLRCVNQDFHRALSIMGFKLRVDCGRESMLDKLKHLETGITRLELKLVTNIPSDIFTWKGFARVHTLTIIGNVSFCNSQMGDSFPQCKTAVTSLTLINHTLTSDTISWLQLHAKQLKSLHVIEPQDACTTTLSALSNIDFDLEEYTVCGRFNENSLTIPIDQSLIDISESVFPQNMHNLRFLKVDLKGRDQSKQIMSSICANNLTHLELFIEGDCYRIIEEVISSYPLVFEKLKTLIIRMDFRVMIEFHIVKICESMKNIKNLTLEFQVSHSSLSKIAELNLEKLDIKVATLKALDTFFGKRQENLTDLTVRGTDFSVGNFNFQAAFENIPKLEHLKFMGCCFEKSGGDGQVNNLVRHINNSPIIHELILEECNLKTGRFKRKQRKVKIVQKNKAINQDQSRLSKLCLAPFTCIFWCFFVCVGCLCDRE